MQSRKMTSILAGLVLVAVVALASARSLWPYFLRPQLIYYYLSQPALRDLMNLIAEDRLNSFPTVWDTSEGVLLSKQIYQPIVMDGEVRFGHQPNTKVLFFETGTGDFMRRFAALDSVRLRSILGRLNTPYRAQASFDGYGFRTSGYDYNDSCTDTVVFTGDSFTEGLWVSDNETFVSLFAKQLNQDREKKTCVVNAGTNGYGAYEESSIARQYFSLMHYRTLYLIHYPNDIAPDSIAVLSGYEPDLERKWRQHLAELEKLAVFARENAVRLILVPIPPKEQFAMPETRAGYQDRLAAFCRDHDVVFWDPFEILSRHTWEELYFDWDPHFNPSGHRIFAAFLWEKSLTLPKTEL